MIISKILLLVSLFIASDSVDRQEITPVQKTTSFEVVIYDSLFSEPEVRLNFGNLDGWKFSTQDDPTFALTDYDDSHWHKLYSSLKETVQLPDSLWQGFGWLRLRIRIDSSFSKQLNVISPHVMGGSELYINGELVLRHGEPGKTADKQKLLGAVLDLGTAYEFLPGATYQIAVRYSLHQLKTLQHISLGSYIQPILLSVYVKL